MSARLGERTLCSGPEPPDGGIKKPILVFCLKEKPVEARAGFEKPSSLKVVDGDPGDVGREDVGLGLSPGERFGLENMELTGDFDPGLVLSVPLWEFFRAKTDLNLLLMLADVPRFGRVRGDVEGTESEFEGVRSLSVGGVVGSE